MNIFKHFIFGDFIKLMNRFGDIYLTVDLISHQNQKGWG